MSPEVSSSGEGGSDRLCVITSARGRRLLPHPLSWDYGTCALHTIRDTYDKIVTDDRTKQATLVAMLAYFALVEPDRLPRACTILPVERDGQYAACPTCRPGVSSLS